MSEEIMDIKEKKETIEEPITETAPEEVVTIVETPSQESPQVEAIKEDVDTVKEESSQTETAKDETAQEETSPNEASGDEAANSDAAKDEKQMPFDKEKMPRVPKFKKRVCRFCDDSKIVMNYKDKDLLEDFITDRGKILPRRVTGTCAKHQRDVAREVKRARIIAIIPFVEK